VHSQYPPTGIVVTQVNRSARQKLAEAGPAVSTAPETNAKVRYPMHRILDALAA
jgi:hypothetical protein